MALVSDAGTPGISDPGVVLVAAGGASCSNMRGAVTWILGPSAQAHAKCASAAASHSRGTFMWARGFGSSFEQENPASFAAVQQIHNICLTFGKGCAVDPSRDTANLCSAFSVDWFEFRPFWLTSWVIIKLLRPDLLDGLWTVLSQKMALRLF